MVLTGVYLGFEPGERAFEGDMPGWACSAVVTRQHSEMGEAWGLSGLVPVAGLVAMAGLVGQWEDVWRVSCTGMLRGLERGAKRGLERGAKRGTYLHGEGASKATAAT